MSNYASSIAYDLKQMKNYLFFSKKNLDNSNEKKQFKSQAILFQKKKKEFDFFSKKPF